MTGQSAEAPNVDEIRQEARRNTRGRFEQWAKNPTCDANTLSAVHNVRLDKAAKAVGPRGRASVSRRSRSPAGTGSRPGCSTTTPQKLRPGAGTQELPARGLDGIPRPPAQAQRRHSSHVRSIRRSARPRTGFGASPPTLRSAESIVAAPMIKIPKGVILPEALLIIDAVTVTTTVDGRAAHHRRRGQGLPGPWRPHRPAAARHRARPGRRLRARDAARGRRPRAGRRHRHRDPRVPRLHVARLELAVRPRQRRPDLPGHPRRARIRSAGAGRARRGPRRRLLGRQPRR